MSFILDALRKSEHERQRQTGPGIADLASTGTRTGLPLWAVALGALLIVNIAVVLVLVLRGESAPNLPTAATETPMQPIAPPAERVSPAPRPAPASSYPAPPRETRAARAAPRLDQPEPEISEQPERTSPELAAAVAAAIADDTADGSLPTFNDVTLQGRGIPELHLDIHVYGTSPAERFVFINMRKYREGAETPEGTRIERITRDGVVLKHRGVRFMLPRQ